MFRVRHTETSDGCFAVLKPVERRQIIRLVAKVQLAPWVDNISKFTLYELGSMVTICHDNQGAWVVYHLDGDVVVLWGVGVGGPSVPLVPDE